MTDNHDRDCSACKSWHEDGGEGPSMFCDDVEPTIVGRGPNWKSVTADNQDQVSLAALLRSKPVPNTFVQTFAWGQGYWSNQEDALCTDLGPAPKLAEIEAALWERLARQLPTGRDL